MLRISLHRSFNLYTRSPSKVIVQSIVCQPSPKMPTLSRHRFLHSRLSYLTQLQLVKETCKHPNGSTWIEQVLNAQQLKIETLMTSGKTVEKQTIRFGTSLHETSATLQSTRSLFRFLKPSYGEIILAANTRPKYDTMS